VTAVRANGRAYPVPNDTSTVVCVDGLDPAYLDDAFERRLVPRLAELAEGGAMALGRAQLPSFTNPNNMSIVTGVAPEGHGVPGNYFLAPDGDQVMLDDPRWLRAPSIHSAMHASGVPVLCVTTKDKLRRLLAAGGVPAVSAERAEEQTLDGLGPLADLVGRPAPGIYEWDCSHWALELGLALAERLGTRLLYVSLTDSVQHAEGPGGPTSDRYLRALDKVIGRYLEAGHRLALVADHGMNAKTRPDGTPNVRYLGDILAKAEVRSARVILPITDPYVAHHAALGSACWVHLEVEERGRAFEVLGAIDGVEEVLERDRAARELSLPADRIGDLVVLADRDTVLGSADGRHDLSALRGPLRSHGGRHEQTVPMLFSERPDVAGRELLAAGATNADVHAILLGAA